jgi:hypothetical protein
VIGAAGGSELARCPNCGAEHPSGERFCPDCHLPLIPAGEGGELIADPRHERARKVKPQLAEGKLVHVVGARNQAEAEFVQGMLLEEGVPSLIRRSAGFDVPDFLAAGPRDILVPASGVEAAREVLLQAEIIGHEQTSAGPRPLRLMAGLLIVWLASVVISH